MSVERDARRVRCQYSDLSRDYTSRERGLKKENEMLRFRAVNARDVKNDKGKPVQENVETSKKDVKTKICHGDRDVQTNSCHQTGVSREMDVRERFQEKEHGNETPKKLKQTTALGTRWCLQQST